MSVRKGKKPHPHVSVFFSRAFPGKGVQHRETIRDVARTRNRTERRNLPLETKPFLGKKQPEGWGNCGRKKLRQKIRGVMKGHNEKTSKENGTNTAR